MPLLDNASPYFIGGMLTSVVTVPLLGQYGVFGTVPFFASIIFNPVLIQIQTAKYRKLRGNISWFWVNQAMKKNLLKLNRDQLVHTLDLKRVESEAERSAAELLRDLEKVEERVTDLNSIESITLELGRITNQLNDAAMSRIFQEINPVRHIDRIIKNMVDLLRRNGDYRLADRDIEAIEREINHLLERIDILESLLPVFSKLSNRVMDLSNAVQQYDVQTRNPITGQLEINPARQATYDILSRETIPTMALGLTYGVSTVTKAQNTLREHIRNLDYLLDVNDTMTAFRHEVANKLEAINELRQSKLALEYHPEQAINDMKAFGLKETDTVRIDP